MANKPQNPAGTTGILERALLKKGLIIPATPEQVAFVESALPDVPELPEHLRDAQSVLAAARAARERRSHAEQECARDKPEVELARAAREAGAITPEIEELMRKCREEGDE